MADLTYLSHPYTDADPVVMDERLAIAKRVTRQLMGIGRHVFSPVVYALATEPEATGWEAWQAFDLAMVEKCDYLFVLDIPGWRESVGVQAEIDRAKLLFIPVALVSPVDLSITDLVEKPQPKTIAAAQTATGVEYLTRTGCRVTITKIDMVAYRCEYQGFSNTGLRLAGGWVDGDYPLTEVTP